MPIATGVELAKGFGAELIFTAVSFEVQGRTGSPWWGPTAAARPPCCGS